MDTEAVFKHLQKHNDAISDFSDRISALAAGALALSITFRKDIIGASPSNLWILQSAWAGFVISIICCTIYRLSTAKAHWDIVQALIAGRTSGIVEVGLFYTICFRVGWAAFLAGVAALAWFAGINT